MVILTRRCRGNRNCNLGKHAAHHPHHPSPPRGARRWLRLLALWLRKLVARGDHRRDPDRDAAERPVVAPRGPGPRSPGMGERAAADITAFTEAIGPMAAPR